MGKITIAIDGHSSTGKSTLAKELAKAMGYIYVDSGAMYRGVALYAMQHNFFKGDELDVAALTSNLSNINIGFVADQESGVNRTYLNGVDVESQIRGMEVSGKVSIVAAIPEVRKHLVSIQKKMGENKGVVMDGRDIGSVVFPNAELKIFMTASAEVRAQRRFEELKSKNQDVTFQEVLANLQKRDKDDSNRADSPLIVSKDAQVIDNSEMSREKQFDLALRWAKERM